MPDVAVQTAPCDELAYDAREQIGDDGPQQKTWNEHAEQVDFVFHAAALSGWCAFGAYGAAIGNSTMRIAVKPSNALLRCSLAASCNVDAIVPSSSPSTSSGSWPPGWALQAAAK